MTFAPPPFHHDAVNPSSAVRGVCLLPENIYSLNVDVASVRRWTMSDLMDFYSLYFRIYCAEPKALYSSNDVVANSKSRGPSIPPMQPTFASLIFNIEIFHTDNGCLRPKRYVDRLNRKVYNRRVSYYSLAKVNCFYPSYITDFCYPSLFLQISAHPFVCFIVWLIVWFITK